MWHERECWGLRAEAGALHGEQGGQSAGAARAGATCPVFCEPGHAQRVQQRDILLREDGVVYGDVRAVLTCERGRADVIIAGFAHEQGDALFAGLRRGRAGTRAARVRHATQTGCPGLGRAHLGSGSPPRPLTRG